MNNKALTPITVFFWLITFAVVYFLYLGDLLNYWSGFAISHNNLTGTEAFFMANMGLWVIIIISIFILAYLYWGGDR